MTTYLTYRNGAGSLTARVQAAVKNFYEKHKVLPATLAVQPAEVSAAREACVGLELSVLVEGNGGVLAGEVWLEVVTDGD